MLTSCASFAESGTICTERSRPTSMGPITVAPPSSISILVGIDAAPDIFQCHREIARNAGDHRIGVAERDHAGGEVIAVLVDEPLAIALQETAALQPFIKVGGIRGIARGNCGVADFDIAAKL